ncbi:MAG: S49 family peptidase [Gammaproteobacteria bacterium]
MTTDSDSNHNTSRPGATSEPGKWERDLLGRLVLATLVEQRRTRRWGIFFKSLLFIYLFALLFLALPHTMGEGGWSIGKGRHTALIDLNGVIAADSEANADDIIDGLRTAFEDSGTAGVILRINSPGGSPVQASQINDAIRSLRKQHPAIPLYAVVTDICASGGYYVAVAADKIYADKASMVGSIGVLMDGFGFVDAMNKLGVERRLYTAGAHKGMLDPFSPRNPDDVKYAQSMLDNIHAQFINAVKQGRGARLKNDPNMFSGLVWTGEQGLALGLIDGFGSADSVARNVIGAKEIVDYTPHMDMFQRMAQRFGASMLAGLMHTWFGAPQLR